MTERLVIRVEGVVQGVGFRPFVYNLARSLELAGRVWNNSGGVAIDIEGEPNAVRAFVHRLRAIPPPRAVVERVACVSAAPTGVQRFEITESRTTVPRTSLVPADVATCDDCCAELFDPSNRRYRYPFITCSYCGPRFTILREPPWDRERTSMAAFPMCDACRREYEDPRHRRFHAESIACWECGPLARWERLQTGDDSPLSGDAAVAAAVAALLRGAIVAVKGAGGYHLACDATSHDAVSRLRARKRRDAKPFAVMVADLAVAREIAAIEDGAASLLASAARPIVLVPPRDRRVADAAAPGAPSVGVMLPYTPLHHLLLAGTGRPLVMTSGNRSAEPIAYQDGDARERLAGIADSILTHDRVIEARCDDSVVQVAARRAVFVRRSRGCAPEPIAFPAALRRPVLALGGHQKNTFCFARDDRAFLSPHVGDLDTADARLALRAALRRWEALFEMRPDVIAHDLHPDYASTREAHDWEGPHIPVQHHHAHVAACLAEHGILEPVIGIVFDGSGLGTDRAIWGGEFLVADATRFERVAHLAYVPMPGGDACIDEPWRMAAAHVFAAGGRIPDDLPPAVVEQLRTSEWALVRQMVSRRLNAPATSSVGRLFDAVAALTGVRLRVAYEAQAAVALEAVADAQTSRTYPFAFEENRSGWVIHTAPLIDAVLSELARGTPAPTIAGAFHNALRDVIVEAAVRIRQRTGLRRVVLSGGVFQNRLLVERAAAELTSRAFDVLLHEAVPCNDGGLALGQAFVAGMTDAAPGEGRL